MEPDSKVTEKLRRERTLVLIKPEGVVRQLIGEIVTRFERKGLKITALKLVWPTEQLAGEHYANDKDWMVDIGSRNIESYRAQGVDIKKTPLESGQTIRRKLMDGISAAPVVALVLEGAHVIETVRRLRGSTAPRHADVGTIGFDYSVESFDLADAGGWALRNIMHCSDSPANAEREIKIWFKQSEIFDYDTATDAVLYSKDWQQHHKHPTRKKGRK